MLSKVGFTWDTVLQQIYYNNVVILQLHGAGVTQSVWCLAMDWTTGAIGDRSQAEARDSVSRSALGPTQPHV
jgi:hypothetical protein